MPEDLTAPRADAERSGSSPAAEPPYPVHGLLSPEVLTATTTAIDLLNEAGSRGPMMSGSIAFGLRKLRQGVMEHERAERVQKAMTVMLRAADEAGQPLNHGQKDRLAVVLLEEDDS